MDIALTYSTALKQKKKQKTKTNKTEIKTSAQHTIKKINKRNNLKKKNAFS